MPAETNAWGAAVKRAVAKAIENGDDKKLDALADALVNAGLAGDVKAIKEIADRLDGKAPQPVQVTGDVQHSYVAFVPHDILSLEQWQAQNKPN